ncbi:MAG: aminoglycoside phosphotransferase family protein [Acidimicrobiales bacterium]
MSHLPLSLTELSPTFVAERLAASGHDVDVAGVAVRPLAGFTGLMGEVAIIDVTYASVTDLPTQFIGKCPLDDDMARMYNAVMNAYQRESGFYRDLADQVPMRVPRAYVNEYDEATGRSVLLIEKLDGTPGDILVGPDIEMFATLVAQLGTMHGQFWESSSYGDLDWAIDWTLPSLRLGIPIIQEHWAAIRQARPDLAPVEILDFFERTWVNDTETWLERVAERPWTFIHGDYEFDNIYFSPDGPVVFDWQTPMMSFPGGDLAWFLGLGATEESVAEEGALLDTYRAALAAAGGPEWSRDELLDDAAASLQFHCTSAASTLNGVITAGAPPEDRSRRRFEKMTAGMFACASRWNVLDRVPE